MRGLPKGVWPSQTCNGRMLWTCDIANYAVAPFPSAALFGRVGGW